MKTIENFFEDETNDLDIFFNGSYDFWHEMPLMYRKSSGFSKELYIIFKSKKEILEFYELIKFKEVWNGEKPILPKNAKQFRVRFPNHLLSKERNVNYRFAHKDTALANPDLYEIISLENLHYDNY